jgi:hypothetical protein
MARITTSMNNVICIDDQFIETDQIAFVSNIYETPFTINREQKIPKEELHKEPHAFHIMLVGHSNVVHIKAENYLVAFLKRKYLVEEWGQISLKRIPTFDLEAVMAHFQDEVENLEDDEDEEDLN